MTTLDFQAYGHRDQAYTFWPEAIPYSGFTYDFVAAVKYLPVNSPLANFWRSNARKPFLADNRIAHALAQYFDSANRAKPAVRAEFHRAASILRRASEHCLHSDNRILHSLAHYFESADKARPAVQAELHKAMSAILALPAEGLYQFSSRLFQMVRDDYGHSFGVIRYMGKPVRAYLSTPAFGWYPHFLSYDIVDGRVSYRDPSLTAHDRILKMLRYDSVFPGDLSDDSDSLITSCAIFKIKSDAFVAAPSILRQNTAGRRYHSFGELDANCVVMNRNIGKAFNIRGMPDEFAALMPADIDACIEAQAARQKAGRGAIPRSEAIFVSREDMRANNRQVLQRHPYNPPRHWRRSLERAPVLRAA